MRLRNLVPLGAFAGLAACADPTVPDTAPPPSSETTVLARQATGLGTPVGVTMAPDSGDRFVIDAWEGLFALPADGAAALLAGPDVLFDPTFGDQRPYRDVAARSDGSFGIAVQSDGLLFDVATQTTARHFCYEPGYYGYDYDITLQITDSLGYDAATDRFVANPQTLTNDEPDRSDLASFEASSGTPLTFEPLGDRTWRASALAVHGDRWLLAAGPLVYAATPGDPEVAPLFDLSAFDVTDISGLAVDADGHLVVLDGASADVLTIENWDPAP